MFYEEYMAHIIQEIWDGRWMESQEMEEKKIDRKYGGC